MLLKEVEKECDRVRGLWEKKIDFRIKVETPVPVEEPDRPTMGMAWEHYKDTYLIKKAKSYADYQIWAYEKYVKKDFEKQKFHDLGGAQFWGLIQSMRDIPTTANRVMAMLSRMWNVCRWKWVDMPANPLYGREHFEEEEGERALSKDELAQLGAVYRASSSPYKTGVSEKQAGSLSIWADSSPFFPLWLDFAPQLRLRPALRASSAMIYFRSTSEKSSLEGMLLEWRFPGGRAGYRARIHRPLYAPRINPIPDSLARIQ